MMQVNKFLYAHDRAYRRKVYNRRWYRRIYWAGVNWKVRMIKQIKADWKDWVRLTALMAGIAYGMMLMIILKEMAR